jgi:hypothetical protein
VTARIEAHTWRCHCGYEYHSELPVLWAAHDCITAKGRRNVALDPVDPQWVAPKPGTGQLDIFGGSVA